MLQMVHLLLRYLNQVIFRDYELQFFWKKIQEENGKIETFELF